MTQRQSSDDAERVDAAFNRVLKAEAEAQRALEDCRKRAAEQIAAAEQEARAIQSRAERRIAAAHRIADQGIERALDSLARHASARPDPDTPPRARIDALVAALAAELTDGDPDGNLDAHPDGSGGE
jgi:uncharacterized membrane protein YccC